MYYEEYGIGNKKTVIFIHGAMWPRSLYHQEELSDEYHTVFIQMDGHGKEFNKRFVRQNIIDKIMEYIDTNKVKNPHIVGFSLGTQIALQLLNDYSKKLGKVALISPLTDAADEQINKLQFSMKAAAKLAKIPPLSKLAASILKIEETCVDDFIEEMQSQKVDDLAGDIMSERLNLEDLENLDKIKNQVYIAVGLKDANIFIETARNLKKTFQDCTLILYERGGHNIPINDYERLNRELRIFFNE